MRDKEGDFHMSGLKPGKDGRLPHAVEASKAADKSAPEGKHFTVHDHADGTFHTEHSDGNREEHPDHLHMTTHIAHHVAPESKHHHSVHDGFGHQSHGIHEDGTHDGTHDHENLEELKGSMDKFLGEEGQEQDDGYEDKEPAPMGGI